MADGGSVVTLAQAFDLARRSCVAGGFAAALDVCRRILLVRPDHAEAARLAADIVRLELVEKGSSRPIPANLKPVGYTADRLLGYGFEIGAWSYGVPTIAYDGVGARLSVGRYCSIADNVTILLGGEHNHHSVSSYPFPVLPELWPEAKAATVRHARGDVVIGNDVWLGTRCLILSGVTLGDGAVVGAGAVVARDVPPYGVAAGNPARVVRFRFSEDDIGRLARLRWWDWDEARVRRHLPLICAGDVPALAEAASRDPP